MGIEYELRVPPSARAAVADALAQQLGPMLVRLDPKSNEPFPNAYVKPIAEGVYVCDNLTNSEVSAQVIRSVLDLLLLYSSEVTIVEP